MFRFSFFIALLAALVIAAEANADPTLIEFHWTNPAGSFLDPVDLGEDALSPAVRGSTSRGRSDWAHAKNLTRKLSVWISRDGVQWRRAEVEILSWSGSGAKGRIKHGDTDAWNALMASDDGTAYGTRSLLSEGYVGLSSSEELWNGEFSARIVSIHLVPQRSLGAVPEPGTLALLGVGLAALGLARRARRRI